MTRRERRSDDDGSRRPGQRAATDHPSSGPGRPSQPRRPGTGDRHGPLVHDSGEQPTARLPLIPREVLYGDAPVVINAGKEAIRVRVRNTADRPIQVGSHYHFAEANPALEFDRDAAWGRRLNVVSGGSFRFEPGDVEEVELIPIGGERIVAGLRGAVRGSLDG